MSPNPFGTWQFTLDEVTAAPFRATIPRHEIHLYICQQSSGTLEQLPLNRRLSGSDVFVATRSACFDRSTSGFSAWFGTRRSVVRIHSPRPLFSSQVVPESATWQYKQEGSTEPFPRFELLFFTLRMQILEG